MKDLWQQRLSLNERAVVDIYNFCFTIMISCPQKIFHPVDFESIIGGSLRFHGIVINAELFLQSASQNSRENNQRHSWSQIR